ncbi:MAG: ketopantoate reductase C-terminal domain-containing protein, partial [Leuconostoc mesenteroides]
MTGTGSIKLQAIGEANAKPIVSALNKAGLNVTLSQNVIEAIWHKAGINSVLNPLTVLLDANIAEFGMAGNGMDLSLNILDEIKKIGELEGINVDVNAIMKDLALLIRPE